MCDTIREGFFYSVSVIVVSFVEDRGGNQRSAGLLSLSLFLMVGYLSDLSVGRERELEKRGRESTNGLERDECL